MPPGEVTALLDRWSAGDARAADEVLPLVYQDLRRVAGGVFRRERLGHTLEPTAVVHEAYLQLIGRSGIQGTGLRWRSRGHFLSAAARVMRRLLVDHARGRSAWKRGGRDRRATDGELERVAAARGAELTRLDDGLRALERVDPEAARVVELRFFAGLTLEEAADVLRVGRRTVVRRWRRARVWLYRELHAEA